VQPATWDGLKTRLWTEPGEARVPAAEQQRRCRQAMRARAAMLELAHSRCVCVQMHVHAETQHLGNTVAPAVAHADMARMAYRGKTSAEFWGEVLTFTACGDPPVAMTREQISRLSTAQYGSMWKVRSPSLLAAFQGSPSVQLRLTRAGPVLLISTI
jgi:hypothetical protein